MLDDLESNLREQVKQAADVYFERFKKTKIIPGKDYIPASGKVLTKDDLFNLIDASLDMWLTAGRFAAQFESEFPKYFGMKYCSLVNSGSSANLVALSALKSYKLGERQLKPGDEVITVAAGFPTTIMPIIQNNLVPVFVDIQIPTYNIDVSQLEDVISEKTRAIVLAHTLGNPFDIDKVIEIARHYDLWVIEDNCDALGSKYKGKYTGTFGDISTVSFYPAHHITMGEGGAVLTNDLSLKRIIDSIRDWGRDCWCPPGKDNTCGKRFSWQLGNLPKMPYEFRLNYNILLDEIKRRGMNRYITEVLNKIVFLYSKLRRNRRKKLSNELSKLEYYIVFFFDAVRWGIMTRSFNAFTDRLKWNINFINKLFQFPIDERKEQLEISQKIRDYGGVINFLNLDKEESIKLINKKYKGKVDGASLLIELLKNRNRGNEL